MRKITSFLVVLSLLVAMGGTCFASGQAVSNGTYRSWSCSWTDMNIKISTFIPSSWTVERRQDGWMNGMSVYSPDREKVISYCCAWPQDYYNDENELIPKDSYEYVDAVIREGTSNHIGDISHREIDGYKAGSVVYWANENKLPYLMYAIMVGDAALFIQVADGSGTWSSTMDAVNYSLNTLEISEIDSYTQALNGYAKANMKWTSMNFKAMTEVPSGWQSKTKIQGWQQGYVLYNDMINLFYFYAGHESFITEDNKDAPNKILDALFANALGSRKYEVSYTSYAGHDAGRTTLTFDNNGNPGVFVIILNGECALYLLAEIASTVNYDQAVENIIDHSLETLVFSEIE